VRGRPSRREVLRAGAALAALAALPACGPVGSGVARLIDGSPDGLRLPSGDTVDPVFHLLARTAWGPRPGDVERVTATGRDAWIEEQLAPSSIDDTACELRLSDCELAEDEPADLMSVDPAHIDRQLARAALIRAVHGKRRLLEVMAAFWGDHFSIDVGKKGCAQTKPRDDRTVVRAHALGKFRDLLGASALSPAMLFYLDGASNRGDAAARPNENYARELMELHTLGVHGGYTQQDVMEAARCLTGWTVEDRGGMRIFHRGETVFRDDRHDDGEKTVLGVTIPAGGGAADVERLLDIVATHPATQRRIAWKLCRRFVSDPPPDSVVTLATKEFATTGGDIAATLRQILVSPEFGESAGRKVKRPFEFVVSALRATGAECRGTPREIDFLTRMGHVPFRYPTPDGYPEEPEPWMGTLLWRWNFAVALTTGGLGATTADVDALARRAGLDPRTASPADLAPLFLGRAATSAERAAIGAYAARANGDRAARRREAAALLLASPAFQVT
jgi:uncharacterized protein (DUF1800 family)